MFMDARQSLKPKIEVMAKRSATAITGSAGTTVSAIVIFVSAFGQRLMKCRGGGLTQFRWRGLRGLYSIAPFYDQFVFWFHARATSEARREQYERGFQDLSPTVSGMTIPAVR